MTIVHVILLVFCLVSPVFAGSNAEVALSVPIETETALAVPGVRSTQDVWLEMISGAKKTIDLEQFYIFNMPGQALSPVLDAIRARAEAGVKVRFLIDLVFYMKNYHEDADRLSRIPNVQVRTISLKDGVQHSKYFVVDQTNAFLGSANFDWLALEHIHEVGLRVTDTTLSSKLAAVFAKDWAAGVPVGATVPSSADLVSVKTVKMPPSDFPLFASPPSLNPVGIPDSQTAITNLLSSAKKSLKIQVYEYSTKYRNGPGHWTVLDDAIRAAAAKGVQVQLMVDQRSMAEGSADLKALALLDNIKVRIVKIPEWSGGAIKYARMIHSKYFVQDGSAAWVGSENWSQNYFMNCRNVGVTVRSPDVIRNLGLIFDRVWNSEYATQL